MSCYISGLIGIGMLGATYATMSVNQEQHNKLTRLFNSELDEKYNNIVVERRNQYFQGLILGLIVSYFSMNYFQPIKTFHRITLYLAITIPISVIFYFLMPKSDWMLNHLKTPEENKAWLDVYKTMKYRYLIGFILGSLSAIPIAYSLC
jgi:hypothetical protein